ncbi:MULTISPECIES: 5-carboxymethyl-2-hydroxymuconate Delta-isomerase [unclassified Psychrobacter]|uniref:5-carboxymethyl-2-hydroxymuconate Delta-isomerase n=1 Tax=unclassified Psychrobacter TaxID=196806 RepID=UPI003FD126A3
MPHLTVQATPNVTIPHEESLLKALNLALWESGHFGKRTDIKARILPIDTFLVGVEDDEQENGFIYLHLKLMAGRDIVTRNQLCELIVTTAERLLKDEQSGRASIQVCAEVEEISAVYHKKFFNLS